MVSKAGVVEITELSQLESWFGQHLAPIRSRSEMKQAVRAWLTLSEELKQDGFYKFETREDSLSVTTKGREIEISGKAIIISGGTGEISALLVFGKNGKLVRIVETSTVKPGVRPICQATKLLDPDPVVRRMAEQDIIVMGRAAKTYLDEQRAKASSELKKAIDNIWRRIVGKGK
jgi:hypothetical protein